VLRVHFEEAAGLDVDAQLARLLVVAVGVFVGDRDREPVAQLLDGLIDRGRVGELGEHDELHVAEGPVADGGAVDHREHVRDALGDGRAVGRVGEVGLARGGEVTEHRTGLRGRRRVVVFFAMIRCASSTRIPAFRPRRRLPTRT
jgi:hypothetical protein